MRRLIAVLVLLGGGGSQLAATGCPMGAPVASEAAVGDHHEGHGGGGHHGAAPAHDRQSAQPEQAPSHPDASRCSMAMGCGAALVLPAVAAASTTPDTDVLRLAIVCSPCSAISPDNDPPPPRLPV